MNNFEQFRAEFPHIQEGYVHLNHAGVSGMSSRSVGRMSELMQRQSENPIGAFPWIAAQSLECRERLARLLGVPIEDLALTKNTGHGLSIVADGLDWREGDEVVFADCEYPANSFPWLAQRDLGVVCKVVPTRPDGTIRPEDYAAAMTERTRVLAVSWVQFTTGFRADIAALVKIAHDNGSIIVVDVIQGLGAFPIDLGGLGVDVAATGSQKWLIGPMGVGGLYIHPETLAHLRLVNMGAGAVKNVMAFATMAINDDLKTTAQRYEEGTPNVMGYAGLAAALAMLEEAGIENVSQQILKTTRMAINGLRERGYTVLSPDKDEDRAGLVMFNHPTLPCDEVGQRLIDAKINVAVRGGRVRFAPHFYNNEADIARALDALPT